jgi:hypothetical protein
MPWATPILETMTKPNENPFVSTWFDQVRCRIVSNRLTLTTPLSDGLIYTKDPTTTADLEARYTVDTPADAAGGAILIFFRFVDFNNYYALRLDQADLGIGHLSFTRVVSGAATTLYSGDNIALQPGYEIGVRMSGTVMTAYVNDSWAAAGNAQATDDLNAFPAAGYLVFYLASTVRGPTIYNVGGGPLPSGVTPGATEQDRGEFRGQFRGQLVGSP